jgi:hypothetical protein
MRLSSPVQFLTRLLIVAILCRTTLAFAQSDTQSLPFTPIQLESLDAFGDNPGKQWGVAGDISGDRKVRGNFVVGKGTGILVYKPGKGTSKPLFSATEFENIDLEFDFLLSKSASFTLLLQNQYQLKITDSWLTERNPITKAPGLWQHVTVQVNAAGLDTNGMHQRKATIGKALLNGQPIDPARISEFPEKEKQGSAGPIGFQGHDLPFAIRNIRYKTYQKVSIGLSKMRFEVYKGLHKNPDTLAGMQPTRTGNTDSISHRVGDRKSQLLIAGEMEIPQDGDYMFKLIAGGGAWFYLDGKLLIHNRGTRDFERAFFERHSLRKGKYPFRIIYSNSDECLVLHYEGPQMPWQSLTTAASVRVSERIEPLEYELDNRPAIQRGFIMHRNKVNPYAAAIGMPSRNDPGSKTGTNYAYDMKHCNLLTVWRGRFIDVSNMWRQRGEKQLEVPLGAKLELSGKPLLALLKTPTSAWPDSAQTADGFFGSSGYRLNKDGFPVFRYAVQNISVEDYISPGAQNAGLTREIKVVNEDKLPAYLLLAEGSRIEKVENGYVIDDKSYYIENLQAAEVEPVIRQEGDRQQLLIPINVQNAQLTIRYDLIW